MSSRGSLAAVSRPGKRIARRSRDGLTRRVRALIEEIVHGGMTRPEAAKKVGLSDSSAYKALKKPAVLTHMKAELDVLRQSERPRNFHVGKEVRDDTAQPGSARVAASRFLENFGQDRHGTTINVGVSVTTPGYTMLIPQGRSELDEALRAAGSSRSVLDLQAGPVEISRAATGSTVEQ